jgi:hypothetical protein
MKMAKYMAAVMRHTNGTVQVLKCDAQNNSDPNAGPIQRHGRIVERIIARHYGDGVEIAQRIEKKK